jgi:hypothetical protein
MPTVMSLRWKGITPEQYDAVKEILDWDNDPLDGSLFHIAAFSDGELRVVDLWESPEKFERFGYTRLKSALAEAGLDGEPEIELYPAHNVHSPAYAPVAA